MGFGQILGRSAGLTEDTTILIPTTMTQPEFQAIADSYRGVPLNSYTLKVLIEDGTRTWNAKTTWEFINGGTLIITGNEAESGLHTNQAAIINSSSQDSDILISDCDHVIVNNIKHTNSDLSLKTFISFRRCNKVDLSGNYLDADTIVAGSGYYFGQCGSCTATDNTFTKTFKALFADCTPLLNSKNNAFATTQPGYGLWVNRGSKIAKEGTQPTGSIADQGNDGSGVISTKTS